MNYKILVAVCLTYQFLVSSDSSVSQVSGFLKDVKVVESFDFEADQSVKKKPLSSLSLSLPDAQISMYVDHATFFRVVEENNQLRADVGSLVGRVDRLQQAVVEQRDINKKILELLMLVTEELKEAKVRLQ